MDGILSCCHAGAFAVVRRVFVEDFADVAAGPHAGPRGRGRGMIQPSAANTCVIGREAGPLDVRLVTASSGRMLRKRAP